jgi:hypothetical protein
MMLESYTFQLFVKRRFSKSGKPHWDNCYLFTLFEGYLAFFELSHLII